MGRLIWEKIQRVRWATRSRMWTKRQGTVSWSRRRQPKEVEEVEEIQSVSAQAVSILGLLESTLGDGAHGLFVSPVAVDLRVPTPVPQAAPTMQTVTPTAPDCGRGALYPPTCAGCVCDQVLLPASYHTVSGHTCGRPAGHAG